MSDPDSTKVCNKCGREWPETKQYFHAGASKSRLGLRPICRICAAKSETGRKLATWQMTKATPGMKLCTGCWEEWPATTQYFHGKTQYRTSLNPQCKLCRARSESGRAIALKEITGEELPKRCSKCKQIKPAKQFPVRSKSAKGLRSSWCKACSIENSCYWYKGNRGRYLEKSFGITTEDYGVLLNDQGGACAVCGRTKADASGKALHVDHSHSTGEIRGLLCFRCNAAIGMLKDDPNLARRLADYLEE